VDERRFNTSSEVEHLERILSAGDADEHSVNYPAQAGLDGALKNFDCNYIAISHIWDGFV